MDPDNFPAPEDSGNTDNPTSPKKVKSNSAPGDFWQELNPNSEPSSSEPELVEADLASSDADLTNLSDRSDLINSDLSGSIDSELDRSGSSTVEPVDDSKALANQPSNQGSNSNLVPDQNSDSDGLTVDLDVLFTPVVDMAIANPIDHAPVSESDMLSDVFEDAFTDKSDQPDKSDQSTESAEREPEPKIDLETSSETSLKVDIEVGSNAEQEAEASFAIAPESDLFAAQNLLEQDATTQDISAPTEQPDSEKVSNEMLGETNQISAMEQDGKDIQDIGESNALNPVLLDLDQQKQEIAAATAELEQVKQEESSLRLEIERLKSQKQKILQSQLDELQTAIDRLTAEQILELEQRKNELQASVSVLQRKQERLQKEMRTTYAGISQDIAVRVQGFKDYLVGSLQDLVASAEQLDLAPPTPDPPAAKEPTPIEPPQPPELATQSFGEYRSNVEKILEQYRTLPDYYGPPWKLRRTFEETHAERVSNWLFEQAGRGAVRTMGTRLQNILVAAAAVSVMRAIYGDRVRVLVLATSPERLGEWRRGFQDCLGINRDSFGPDRGVVLFEDPDPLTFKGDRLVKEGLKPMVIVDEAEEFLFIDMLRFPLILAFGRDPEAKTNYASRDYYRDFMDF